MAFCPHPPLLVPEVAAGAAAELDGLRAACRDAIGRAVAQSSEILVLGAGDRWARHAPNARGSLAGYGVALEIPLGSDEPGPVELPLSLTVGGWLLRDALGPDCGAWGWSVGADNWRDVLVPSDETRRALLVMGDGSARRSTSAPGYLDPRAADYDACIAAALRSGEPDMLRTDPRLADELLAAGARAWNAAAAALDDTGWDAELLYDDAPYGVGYFAAVWTRRG